jgi:hypothetical protein
MATGVNVPVLVGTIPLFHVTSFVLEEGYKTAAVAGSKHVQMVAPTTKSIKIDALLIKEFRVYRPALEALAMTSRLLASATAPAMALAGVPVIYSNGVHLDMQFTSLVFSQDNTQRETLKVGMSLVHVPRSRTNGIVGGALDIAVAAGGALI